LTSPAHGSRGERAALRRFGLTVGIAFLAVAALVYWRHRSPVPAPAILGAAGATLLSLAGVAPSLLRPVERLWMKLALAMGWVMTRVVLGLLFVAVFTPAGLLRRLLGRDPMHLRFDRDAPTYWHRREDDPSPRRMEKMF
jgi:hypothetical protein